MADANPKMDAEALRWAADRSLANASVLSSENNSVEHGAILAFKTMAHDMLAEAERIEALPPPELSADESAAINAIAADALFCALNGMFPRHMVDADTGAQLVSELRRRGVRLLVKP